jgi:Predicted exosome subunit/U3 small nucleolar ribonucleoprotein (snoRNP) component, contains IMP4 domain
MVKKKAHPSLKGKKPVNTAGKVVAKSRTKMVNPGHIRNRLKRSEVYGKYLMEKKALKRQKRIQRAKEAEALGEDVPAPKQTPRTLDNARQIEPTMVQQNDVEVMGDEATDEFADYFSDTVRPKILITTRPRPSSKLFHFIGDLMRFFPQLYYYPRKSFSVKDICEFAVKRNFTHLIVLSEKNKVCNGMIISHLRRTGAAAGGDEHAKCAGPTAFFKVSNVITSSDVPNHGSATSHVPELVLNGFGTRLGHRVGRFLGSLFPHNAQFQGRQVATFHNQRDYIFVRHHRYIFEAGKEEYKDPNDVDEKKRRGKGEKEEEDINNMNDGEDSNSENDDDGNNNDDDDDDDEDLDEEQQQQEEESSDDDDDDENQDEDEQRVGKKSKKPNKKTKARLQELGPRFTLKLRWIQEGTFDTHFGEYEWFHKRKEMDTTRRKFHL